MWVFYKKGFLSIVSNDGREDELLVRTRVYEDLLDLCESLGLKPVIAEEERCDYQYAMPIKRELLAKYIHDEILKIDYHNVRFNMVDSEDHLRSSIYSKIWSLTLQLTERLKNVGTPFS